MFTELQNAQAIALPYDGLNPLPPQYLLPEAALPGRADQLLRSRRARGAMSSLDRILPFLQTDRGSAARSDHHRGDGERRRPARVRRARRRIWTSCRTGTLEARNLTVAIKNIARACGDEISDVQPMLDARLEDGSRVAAMFPPCAVGGPDADDPEVHAAVHARRPGRRRHAYAGAGATLCAGRRERSRTS